MNRLARRIMCVMVSCLLLGIMVQTDVYAETHAERISRKVVPVLSAADVKCTVPKAPVIQVLPKSADIRYDYSQSTKQLTAQGSSTVNPYAANLDATTGGLRADKAQMNSSIKMGTQTYPSLNVGCIWYDSIVVNIALNPVIYIAKEYQQEPCKSAIMGHEVKHVTVDREVMNKYAVEIGRSIQMAVNQAGAFGPFNANEMSSHQDRLIDHIQSAINSQQLMLEKEMRQRQAQVDSLPEYERVSKICKNVIRKSR